MKISIVYFSQTGKTRTMAEEIAAGMLEQVPGVEVRLFPVDEANREYIKESKAVVFGTPTICCSFALEMKKWFDAEARLCNLGGKMCGAFSTAKYAHGGGDVAIQNIICHALTSGMLVYSTGHGDGGPPIHLGPLALEEGFDGYKKYFRLFGSRFAKMAEELYGD